MYIFGKQDTYKISQKEKKEKFIVDYKVLVRLYGPIIGPIATSLYLTMISELSLNKGQKSPFKIDRLLKLLQIEQKDFNEAIETLKENQLLSVKANKNNSNNYLFELISVKRAKDFFEDKKLIESLEVTVDSIYYKQLENYFLFSVDDESDYVDIDDIQNDEYEMNDEQFYEQFHLKFKTLFDSNAINEKVKKEVKRLKKLFKVSYDDVEMALLCSTSNTNGIISIDLEKLNDYFTNKFSKASNNDREQAQLELFENTKAISYYGTLAGRTILTPSETNMINALLDKPNMTDGILNVVFNYYFLQAKKYNSSTKLPAAYFEKVVDSLVINDIRTTKEAMEYFRNFNNKKKQETAEDVKKEIKKEEFSQEDLDAFDELKRLLGG